MKRQHVISLILTVGLVGSQLTLLTLPTIAGEVKTTGKEPKVK